MTYECRILKQRVTALKVGHNTIPDSLKGLLLWPLPSHLVSVSSFSTTDQMRKTESWLKGNSWTLQRLQYLYVDMHQGYLTVMVLPHSFQMIPYAMVILRIAGCVCVKKNTDMRRNECLLGSSDFLGFCFPAFKPKSGDT